MQHDPATERRTETSRDSDPSNDHSSIDPEQATFTVDGFERQVTLDDVGNHDRELPTAVPRDHLLTSAVLGDVVLLPVDPADCSDCDGLPCWEHARRGLAGAAYARDHSSGFRTASELPRKASSGDHGALERLCDRRTEEPEG
jgi:hypothetical protein